MELSGGRAIEWPEAYRRPQSRREAPSGGEVWGGADLGVTLFGETDLTWTKTDLKST